jgi:DUF4097 and DUF4098 domain-containing protein YvlB
MKRATLTSIPIFILFLTALCFGSLSAGAWERFERTYTPRKAAHLSITNTQGEISVIAWNRKTVSVRANTAPPASVVDQVSGDDISISVKPGLRLGRADFEVYVPADASLTLNNVIGQIEVKGLTGHLSIKSFNSNVKMTDIRSPSVDVLVTSGNLFFDGELQRDGSYSLQSMRGDIDVSIPTESSFQLTARALNENINLGDFLSSLSGLTKGSKQISGTYGNGGPRLSITAFAGRVLLHKK